MKGKVSGNREVAKALKQQGLAINMIMTATGLSQAEINTL